MRNFENISPYSTSRSSEVIDLGANQKRICNFLLVINSNYGRTLHRFRDMTRYWSKIAEKTYPPLIRHVPLGLSLDNFATSHTFRVVRSWGYRTVYISRSCFRPARYNTGCDTQTDGGTDGRTDGHVAVARTALCIASRG